MPHTFAEWCALCADEIQAFEPDTLHPYDGTAYAAAEAQQHTQECAA